MANDLWTTSPNAFSWMKIIASWKTVIQLWFQGSDSQLVYISAGDGLAPLKMRQSYHQFNSFIERNNNISFACVYI